MANPVPVQTYYVPVREDDTVLIGSDTGHVEIGKGASLQDVDTFSLISFGIAAEGTIITYDNWEDGYEFDVTAPSQSSTYLWGDGDASNNGVYIAALDRNGDNVVSDDEDYFLGGEAFNITDIVDLQRSSSDVFFDASDKISATFPIAVSRLTAPMENSNDSDPNNDSIRNIATGAVEVQDTSKYGDSYVIPVGGDGTGNTDAPTGAFDLAFAHVMAEQNGTEVYLNGTLIDTIDAGQTVVRQVVEGDEITTYDPASGSDGPGVQVTLITRDDGSEDNEQRWYSLTPTDDWSNDYVTPVGVSTDFGTSSRGESAVWLYNDGADAIDVVMQTRNPSTGVINSTTIEVPAGGSVLSPKIPDGSGARFTSAADEPFYAVLQVDVLNGGERNDWGHPLIPVEQLTSQGLITFGFGNTAQLTGGNSNESRSLTFVTPLEDATINVDFNGDGTVDKTVTAKAFESVTITDPADKNMTGALIFATDAGGKPVDIAIAHGQDPGQSAPESQSIDAGVVTLPLPEVFSSKSSTLAVDADDDGVYSPGDTVEFTISTLNFGRIDIGEGGYVVLDDLASFAPHLDYVEGSTTFDLSDGRGALSLADSASGTPFPLDDGFSTLGRGDGSSDSAILNVGEAHTLTFQAVIKDFADLPAGTVGFENAGELQTNSGGLLNDFSSNAPIVFDAGVAIEKTTNGKDADTGTGPSIVIGSTVTWQYAVTNEGETFLSSVDVTDDQGETPVYASGDVNNNDMIDPGETWIFEATGTAEAGQYRNIGTVTATPTYADGSPVPVSAGGGMVTASDPSGYFGASIPSIAFDKVVLDVAGNGPNGTVTKAGQKITYALVVTNDGDIDLTNVTVVDPLTGTSETIATLAVGEEKTFEVTYTVRQSDLNTNGGGDGDIDNTATADADGVDAVSDHEDVPIELKPSLAFDKIVLDVAGKGPDGTADQAGQIITYALVVKNDGNVKLTNVEVVDPLTGTAETIDSLAVGEEKTIEVAYTVRQHDLNTNGGGDGDIDNKATADADQVDAVSDKEEVPLDYTPSLAFDKIVLDVAGEGPDGTADQAGQIITYALVVKNDGNVKLTNVEVVDPLTGTAETIDALAVGGEKTFEVTYTVRQHDLNTNGGGDGDIDNKATADADQVDAVSDKEEVPLDYTPSLAFDKIVLDVAGKGPDGTADQAGQIITYALVVKNDGNVNLSNVSVKDPLTGTSETIDTLRVGEEQRFEVSYTVTQEDLNTNGGGDGDIDNTGRANADEVGPVFDKEEVPVDAAPSLAFDKVVVDVAGKGPDGKITEAGQTITYALVVENDGNVDLTNVTVVDPLTGTSETIDTLAVGETKSFEAAYKVHQRDINDNGGGDGDIDNTATANADQVHAVSDHEDVPLVYDPSLKLRKKVTAVDAAGDGVANFAGNVIEYSLKVTNNGNVALNQVVVTDPLTGTDEVVGRLRPGESATIQASYTLTAKDLRTNGGGDGDIDNTAYATSLQTDEVSDDASVDIEVPMMCTDFADEFVLPKLKDATIGIHELHKNGTNADDVIFGNKQANTISTNGGENVVRALKGDDIVNGGNKADMIFGDAGNDIINGNAGNDLLSGGALNDRIYGGGGRDKILGGGGDDLVEAGAGRDQIHLGTGNDTVQGEGGKDCIAGGKDQGKIWGNEKKGFKILTGDEMWGNGGADTFEYKKGDGVDFLFDFKGEDNDSLVFFGISEDQVDLIVANTRYGPAAGIAIDADNDGKYEGGVFFQQYRDTDDLADLIQSGDIDFII